ncbi:hypothetical protein BH10ACI3_BH10ACI3_09530 [soil metagenome]
MVGGIYSVKSILTLGLISFALTFCGLSEKLKGLTDSSGSNANTTAANTANSPSKSGDTPADKATLSGTQQAIVDGGTETRWDDQGVSWVLPKSWSKMDVKKEAFNYKSPDNAFLLVNISVMPDNFPMDISLKAYYDQAMQQLKNGKYESVRMVTIDGIKGVEFTEAPPEGKDDPRRHQWIAYRQYLGQSQQLNVMTSTKGSNFAKHIDDFQAILYSMKVIK